ncbi:MAG: tyrosine-type recombinase/integrase, partial [Pirellulaceae bacterium]
FAWEEFFRGEIRNVYTRRNYLHAVRRVLAWTDAGGIELPRIAPAHVGAYLDESTLSAPTKKLHLAAIRAFFDRLVLRQGVVLNPAQSVRGPKHATVEGRTPEIGPAQVRQLLSSIGTCDIVACRDRALIATLVYTAARVGAVVRLRVRDLLRDEATWSIRFHEKGGKQREIPVREDLRHLLSDYFALAGATTRPADAPLFRSAVGKTKSLSDKPLTPGDACRMLKRRLRRAELPMRLSPHSFRVAVITDLLQHGASLEDVQNLAGHADPRTTRLYDRRQRQVTRNLVERITI